MMRYAIVYSEDANEDLKSLDHAVARRIVLKLRFYADCGTPMRFAKPLKGEFVGLYRFRVGDYRVIFRKDANETLCILFVLAVSHRSEAYE